MQVHLPLGQPHFGLEQSSIGTSTIPNASLLLLLAQALDGSTLTLVASRPDAFCRAEGGGGSSDAHAAMRSSMLLTAAGRAKPAVQLKQL